MEMEEEGPPRRGPRANKPLTEKKRRLRINASLDQIKCLVMDALGQDPASVPTKFEKADILELTVRYLQNQRMNGPSHAELVNQYREGYQTCIRDVTSFLSQKSPNEPKFKQSMLEHLDECLSNINRASVLNSRAAMTSNGMDYVDGPTIMVGGTQPLQDLNQNIVQNGLMVKDMNVQQQVQSPMPVVSQENVTPQRKGRASRASQQQNRTNQQQTVNRITQQQTVQQQQAVRLPHSPHPFSNSVSHTTTSNNLVITNVTSSNPTSTNNLSLNNTILTNIGTTNLSGTPVVYTTLGQVQEGLPPIQSFAPIQGQTLPQPLPVAQGQSGLGVFEPMIQGDVREAAEDTYQTFTVLQPVKQEVDGQSAASQFFSMFDPNTGFT